MSHRSDCPDRWTAEHEGERAQEWGRGQYANPYDDPFHSGRGCEEASRFWDDGYRRAERREEERLEEEAHERRVAARREQERLEEEYWENQQYYAEQEPQMDERAMCESNGHQEYPEAVDRFGRRCYCGHVRFLDVASV